MVDVDFYREILYIINIKISLRTLKIQEGICITGLKSLVGINSRVYSTFVYLLEIHTLLEVSLLLDLMVCSVVGLP